MSFLIYCYSVSHSLIVYVCRHLCFELLDLIVVVVCVFLVGGPAVVVVAAAAASLKP